MNMDSRKSLREHNICKEGIFAEHNRIPRESKDKYAELVEQRLITPWELELASVPPISAPIQFWSDTRSCN